MNEEEIKNFPGIYKSKGVFQVFSRMGFKKKVFIQNDLLVISHFAIIHKPKDITLKNSIFCYVNILFDGEIYVWHNNLEYMSNLIQKI